MRQAGPGVGPNGCSIEAPHRAVSARVTGEPSSKPADRVVEGPGPVHTSSMPAHAPIVLMLTALVDFTELRGEREFSGELIVRPLQSIVRWAGGAPAASPA